LICPPQRLTAEAGCFCMPSSKRMLPLLRVTDTVEARPDRHSQNVRNDADRSVIDKVRRRQSTKWGTHGSEGCAPQDCCSAASMPYLWEAEWHAMCTGMIRLRRWRAKKHCHNECSSRRGNVSTTRSYKKLCRCANHCQRATTF
jgi:hypothetical protein